MISENEVRVRRNHHLRICPIVAEVAEHIRFFQLIPIYIHAAFLNTNVIARHADYALDVALARIAGISENDNIAPVDGLPVIDELVDEDALLVVETGHHAGSLNLYRLIHEDDDEN